jgi:PAS domain-containing protein
MDDTLRILLVTADPEMIRKVGEGLHRQGSPEVIVEGADGLVTALRRLRSGAFDLALADLSVGPGDGLHVLSELLGTMPGLPVVALADGPAAPDLASCLAVGAHDRVGAEALDGPGLCDRLLAVLERSRASLDARLRSQRMAASLGAAGTLAWHYEAGENEVWLASPEPAAWQLPGPECRESLEALRGWLHPDDREIALRRIAEAARAADPWDIEARVKVAGGAYRWCALRGRVQLDGEGRLLRASGVVSDAQSQHKRLLSSQHEQRFMRAIFESNRLPQAVVDAAGVITQCNHAWLALEEPGCHAGRAFEPGSRLVDSQRQASFGDLDTAVLARGLKQVLGGVVERYQCEYGDDARRWRISISPLLNPGIAGALVTHEEVTASRRAERETRSRLASLARDFQAVSGPVFRLGPDFEVRAANEAAMELGRAPVVGRDIMQVLPRVHADAVSDGLVALAAGSDVASRDTRPGENGMTRWFLSVRRGGRGDHRGFLLQAVDVTDLAPAKAPGDDALAALGQEAAQLRVSLAQVEGERERLGTLLAEAEEKAQAMQATLEQELETLRDQADEAVHASEKLRIELEQAQLDAREARLESEDALRREARSRQAREQLAEAVEAERARVEQSRDQAQAEQRQALAGLEAERDRLAGALAAAEGDLAHLRGMLSEASDTMRSELGVLLERTIGSLLPQADAPRRGAGAEEREAQ